MHIHIITIFISISYHILCLLEKTRKEGKDQLSYIHTQFPPCMRSTNTYIPKAHPYMCCTGYYIHLSAEKLWLLLCSLVQKVIWFGLVLFFLFWRGLWILILVEILNIERRLFLACSSMAIYIFNCILGHIIIRLSLEWTLTKINL